VTDPYEPFLPRRGTWFDRTVGKGSSHVLLAADPCPRCTRAGALHYDGSDVLEGSLELNHLVHTEVDDHFSCTACGATWTENRYI
jgi:hypothetical protein